MLRYSPQLSSPSTRRGTLVPAMAVAILAVGGAMALVFNQLWLSSAHREMQTATNAAALAAANALADDDLLRIEIDHSARATRIRELAQKVVHSNPVLGQSALVNIAPQQDVRFGREVLNASTGQSTFIETDYAPTSVIVTAHRDRVSGNPVTLFFPYVTGVPVGDVAFYSEASVSNKVNAVRPLPDANVPAWPLAILEADHNDNQGWTAVSDDSTLNDQWSWNETTKQVIQEPDQIPEFILHANKQANNGNVCLVDIGSDLVDDNLQRQLQAGFSSTDLQTFGGQLDFASDEIVLPCTYDFFGMPVEELRSQIGQARIVLLYQPIEQTSRSDIKRVSATQFVSIRLLQVSDLDSQIQLIVQPTVVATRTAVLDPDDINAEENPYIYRLALTQK